jgi:hypothetical protein
MFLAQAEKTGNLGDDALDIGEVEPGHLDYFCQKHNNHLQNLLICSGPLLN